MADLFDLFDEPAPKPAPADATPPPAPVAIGPGRSGAAGPETACSAPAVRGAHVCWVGGGMAVFSDDNERTWACSAHIPWGFHPSERGITPGGIG